MSSRDHITAARDVYDSAATTYVQFVGTDISAETECSTDRSMLTAFIELMKDQASNRVVDVGCGPGRVAAFMARHGLEVVGVDVSRAMLAIASAAHPHIEFKEGRLDALPIESAVCGGVVCWYSIIYTPPDRLEEAFDEFVRVLIPRGHLLLAFQTEGEPLHRENAFGTHLVLTSYRHSVGEVLGYLENAGFEIHTTAIRAAELEHETTSQGFVIASRLSHNAEGQLSPIGTPADARPRTDGGLASSR